MRSMAGLMLAFGLLTVGPAAAQSDLSALRGTARMPITMTIEGGSLGDALSMLAEAADIEIRVEPDWAASPPLTARFLNARFGDALTFLLNQRQLKATVLDSRTVVVSTISGQDPPPAVAAAKPAVVRLRVEIYRNQQPLARPMLAIAAGSTGSVSIPKVAKITVTPTASENQRVSLAFEITSGATTVKPQLVLDAGEPGTISWISGSDYFELRVIRMR